MRFTVADCVALNARAFPERVAIEVLEPRSSGVHPVQTWTYGHVWRRVIGLAGGIGGVEAGPHGPMVAILLPNGADHALAYLACQVVGAAAVPVNNRLAEPEVEYVLTDSGASVLLTGEPFLELAHAVAARTGALVVDVQQVPTPDRAGWTAVPAGGTAGADPTVAVSAGDAPDGADPTRTSAVADRTCLVAYTSGTTGFPKGSLVSNGALLARFAQWGWTFGLTPDQVLSVPGPLFHMSYGGLTLASLVLGGRSRIMTAFDAEVALGEYADHSTWVFLVPSMLAMIAEAWQQAGQPRLGRLGVMLSSGAPGPMSLLDTAFDVFPQAAIAEAYGWTEGGWVTYERKHRDDLVPHSVGWPMLGTEVAVIDPDSERRLSPGEPGEVAARSILPFLGYLGRPDATAAARTRDGLVRSGDVGIVRHDGRLTIVDRVKDMIISGGENVYCAEVERVLVEHPGVLQAAVVGLPDDTWGDRVVAAVVARPGSDLEGGEVIDFTRRHLAHYKCPRQVVVLVDLPRNPMGKVLKTQLVERLL
jgi:acyl-CoA synthetase (AMP-forming)/AMP-acid ligase II